MVAGLECPLVKHMPARKQPSMTSKKVQKPPVGYARLLAELKSRIVNAQQRATLSVNQEQIRLYWQIGRDILERQADQDWGSKVIDRLASELKGSFPNIKGFSGSNLTYVRHFAEHCKDALIGQQRADQLPWFHIVMLIAKVNDPERREWYARHTIQQGWSRTTLTLKRLLSR